METSTVIACRYVGGVEDKTYNIILNTTISLDKLYLQHTRWRPSKTQTARPVNMPPNNDVLPLSSSVLCLSKKRYKSQLDVTKFT